MSDLPPVPPDPDILHDHRRWVFSDVLSRQADRYGERTWIRLVDGGLISFGQADRIASRVARMLLDLGLGQGDAVAVMLPNGEAHLAAWFGIARAGAVHVAVNTDYKGAFLKHVLNNSRARLVVIDAEWLSRLEDVLSDVPHLERVLVVGAPAPSVLDGVESGDFEAYAEYSAERMRSPVSYRDPACVMYTSGTTGPSKGVVMPHAHIYLFGLGTVEHMRMTERDVFYIVLPLFHANAMFMQLYATLIAGATAVLRRRFSASRWLHDVVDYGATLTNSLGVVAAFVLAQPASELDRRHHLRAIGVAPNPPELDPMLRERFALPDVVGLYGMTEVNIPLYTPLGVSKPGSCGKTWERYYELQIVDPDTDLPVPSGTVGEIVVRPRLPFGFMLEYMNMPEETVKAWRNFWFHTGDAATMDEDGYVYFVDRIKDCIRRRGENISSFEIEQALAAHPAVAEVAAVAVASGITGGEDEIKVVVVLREALSLEAFADYCRKHLPGFAVPRYIEFVDALPKTPTNKVQKNVLREEGVTAATWDRLYPQRNDGGMTATGPGDG